MGSIIEMVIVLAASALLLTQGIREDIAHKRAALMASEGQNEAVINDALSKWVTENYAAKLAEFTASGSTTLTPPTIDDLYTNGDLKQAHRNGPFWGGTYIISMNMVPSNCSADAGNCHVVYLLYPSKPLLKRGVADVVGASQIAQAGGSQFGYSTLQNSATVAGLNGAWSTPNPLSGSPAAAIVATNGVDSDGDSIYIRRDGSLTWTGDQNVNNVSLKNVNDIKTQTLEASGAVTAASVAASGAVTSATATATGAISGNSVTATTTLQAGNIAVPRAACSPNGATASAYDGSGQQFTCQYGVWLPTGGNLLRMGYSPVYDGWNVAKPSCPAGGTPIIELAPQYWYVNESATVNYNAYDYGTYWNIRITDGPGAGISAMATAGTYCSY
ncbi:hypothetical protein BTH42_31610 [Burkholderia sp. SRS-W-2-2016]|uniref:hypothetical protein n=1 Tax=Burkholderia sp. SRS-W-2-2016 TaxID=1926878 RepID=UPI00094B2206|nr:hypothetical protein [Burkholderia sp. SRS-W-2-2016]OLL27753.1 hypothetical protein BTH42_31610 [Burkholderia sp. SRS-W-2-2016]